MSKQERLAELTSEIEALKFKIREAVARCNGVVFVVNAQQFDNGLTAEKLLQELRTMNISILHNDKDEEKPSFEEIDLRIDVEEVKKMVGELGEKQDEQYKLMKENFNSLK